MNKQYLTLFEMLFNMSYLIIIWTYVILMFTKKSKYQLSSYFKYAFLFLAFGDTFHVGLRILAHLMGDIKTTIVLFDTEILLTGIGAFFTAITVTITYAYFNQAWYERFKRYKKVYNAIFLLAIFRLIIILLPQNNWFSSASFGWALFRNLPLTLIGLMLVYVMYTCSRLNGDTVFRKLSLYILLSYAFYIPVILFVRQVPMLGMLMMPKTVMYLFMIIVVYNQYYKEKT